MSWPLKKYCNIIAVSRLFQNKKVKAPLCVTIHAYSMFIRGVAYIYNHSYCRESSIFNTSIQPVWNFSWTKNIFSNKFLVLRVTFSTVVRSQIITFICQIYQKANQMTIAKHLRQCLAIWYEIMIKGTKYPWWYLYFDLYAI